MIYYKEAGFVLNDDRSLVRGLILPTLGVQMKKPFAIGTLLLSVSAASCGLDLPHGSVSPGSDLGSCGALSQACCQNSSCSSGLMCSSGTCILSGSTVQSCVGSSQQECANCGIQTRSCNNGVWSAWGQCQGQGPSLQSCGNCGTQSRTCTNGVWSTWGVCQNQGQCMPGQVQTCGSGGSLTCDNSCRWGTCQGQACSGSPMQSCGNCGTQTRSCSNGVWSAWGACIGQGQCSPGQTQICASGATQSCSNSCQWSSCPSCLTLRDNTAEQISTNAVICAKIYYGTTLRITGSNINVTSDVGYASLSGRNSYLLLDGLRSSTVKGLAVIDTDGRPDGGPFPLYSKAIQLTNTYNNRLVLWGQCNKTAWPCVPMVLDGPSNDYNTVESVAAINGQTGIAVFSGGYNWFKYYVSGVIGKSGTSPICYIDYTAPSTNSFVLGSCSN